MSKRILMVVTNHTTITSNQKTGLWLEEFAVPYNLFKERGHTVHVTSISGGDVPLDPNSLEGADKPEWTEAKALLNDTKKLTGEFTSEYDAIFLPGGHGTMFDFPDNEILLSVIQTLAEENKIIAAVCHGPAGLVNVTYKDGTPLVKGKKVNGFTDEEEKEMQLEEQMPFMLEETLRERGGEFVSGDKWTAFSVRDGNLITGQNPMSSESTALKVIEALEE
ncbi:type 1 glutamine amidotransferase domain-containing protein [Bacillus sp. FJAT-45037]|uniref:type 1 glutamine amidotransferase domain-containing protein n=1 Tax=Bacillus sp. FJAT-45037 TaxID=2011007 RepID=UPI000C23894C|nr:type 1 glutamine amidotransferase domain-containing protein [Bacillus sp. FJAT-45037]